MKNKMRKRVMAGSMAAVLTAVGVGAYGFEQDSMSEVKAKDEDTETLKEAAENVLGDTTTGSDGELYKDESVYVNADASGKVTNTTVTEWLKNPEKGTVSDETTLKDVKNVKGNEKYKEGSGDTINWKSKGKDIYYQGTTDAELPVDMDITYKLNGKEISPEDLAGKNGKLEMTINYENKSKQEVEVDGEKTEMYTPFTVATAMMLSTDEYTNVTIDNGKIVSDGDKNIVVGITFPGLSEDLGLEDSDLDIDIPDSVTITADVTDVSVGATYTMASANLLDSIGLDDVDSFDDLDDSIDKLKDATNQLVDGSKELSDGSKTLADGTKTLSSGAKSLADGNKQLADGAKSLADGNKQLSDGINTLNNKSGDLITGVNSLADGVTAYTGGVASVADGASALYTGTTGLVGGIQTAEQGAANLLAAYAGDGSEKNPGADKLLAGTKDTISKASGAVSVASENATNAQNSATSAAMSAGTVIEQINSAKEKVANAQTNNTVSVTGKDEAKAAVDATDLTDEQKKTIEDAIEAISATPANASEITGAQEILANAAKTAGKAATDATAAATSAGTAVGYLGEKGAAAALNGAEAYANGLGLTMDAMKAGTKELQYSLGDNGTDEKPMIGKAALQLQAGAKKIADGSATLNKQSSVLNAGVTSLKDGGAQLASGVNQLAAGANSAASGASTLSNGANSASEGANTLANGTDTLVSGADQLSSGADTLADGMSEYKTDAIDKLTDIFDGDIGKVTSRIDAMKDLSTNYKSFAGIKDGMNGSTKFIIETEGVDK